MANIIITGANEGIGYFMVEKLLADGNRVSVLDIETENLAALKNEYKNNLIYYKTDLRNSDEVTSAVDETVKEFGTLDIAVHNACKCTFQSEAETDFDTYKDVFDVNYFGALRFVKSVTLYMTAQKKGRVIFTSSGVGVTGFMNISPYSSTKGALESLAKCLRIEYAKHNITFHIMQPPLTRTKSASPLPVPDEFKAKPEKVGYGLAKHINSKSYIICHSWFQKFQTMGCYFFPIKMGALLSKMTADSAESKAESND
ncbi:MAG: SDR family oxidoreductase [Acutalibacteraceae bacterium]|nr:SDR family oxidoreductase [Acutalibacteraceae bacterium]